MHYNTTRNARGAEGTSHQCHLTIHDADAPHTALGGASAVILYKPNVGKALLCLLRRSSAALALRFAADLSALASADLLHWSIASPAAYTGSCTQRR